MTKGNVRYVGRPDLVGPCDFQTPQQVRVFLVLLAGPARGWTRCHRLKPHHAHQALDPLAVDVVATAAQFDDHTSAAIERPLQVDPVNLPHQGQLAGVRRDRLVRQPRAVKGQQNTLSSQRWTFRRRGDHLASLHQP